MQKVLQEGSEDTRGYDTSFPHIKLASAKDDQLTRSLLESILPTPSSTSTPYRLPKLSSGSSTCSDRSDGQKDDRHQSDQNPGNACSKGFMLKYLASHHPSAKTLSTKRRLPNPPYTIAQLRRAQNIHVPSFRKAHFAPLVSSPIHPVEMPHLRSGDEPADVNRDLTRASSRFTHASRSTYAPRSAAVSMTIPVATGSAYSPPPVHKAEWRLSPYEHKNYDAMATSNNFGPYSRGFVIHCSAPKSWLHMKLRRTKTTLM